MLGIQGFTVGACPPSSSPIFEGFPVDLVGEIAQKGDALIHMEVETLTPTRPRGHHGITRVQRRGFEVEAGQSGGVLSVACSWST